MNVLEIKGLRKSFGTLPVIRGLDLAVPEGAIYGFVGQNGAGKTTTMKMVLGLLPADAGEITVGGERVRYGETGLYRHVGYLPDDPAFYGYMTPLEYLRLCGEVAGMTRSRIQGRSEELLSLVGLADAKKRRVGRFSRGMKQRLGIAQALLHEPRLLICDEPTSALDPAGRKDILDIMLALQGRTTVLFSTHILSDVERVCDHVAVLHQGKLALAGTLAQVRSRRGEAYAVEFDTPADALAFLAGEEAALPPSSVAQEGAVLTITGVADAGLSLVEILARKSMAPRRFERLEPTLEHLFLEAIQ